MPKEATLQVRMDSDLKKSAEELYAQLGTSLAEAVRIFARQSVEDGAMPFVPHITSSGSRRPLGLADGQFEIPDDIDGDNDLLAAMFGVQ